MSVNVIKNFISKDYANIIIKGSSAFLSEVKERPGYFEDNHPRLAIATKEYETRDDYRIVTKDHEESDMMISNAMYLIKARLENFYQCDLPNYEGNIVKLTAGATNGLHSDMYRLDGSKWNDGAGREDELEYSAILYLSDHHKDFVGGEITFPQHDLTIYPEVGTLVFFRGDLQHTHEVGTVTGGNRYSIVMFCGKD